LSHTKVHSSSITFYRTFIHVGAGNTLSFGEMMAVLTAIVALAALFADQALQTGPFLPIQKCVVLLLLN